MFFSKSAYFFHILLTIWLKLYTYHGEHYINKMKTQPKLKSLETNIENSTNNSIGVENIIKLQEEFAEKKWRILILITQSCVRI